MVITVSMLDSLLALPAHAHYMGDLSRLSSVEAQEVKEGPVGMKVKMSCEQMETRSSYYNYHWRSVSCSCQ